MSGILEALDAMYEVKGESEINGYRKKEYYDTKSVNVSGNGKGFKDKHYGPKERNSHDLYGDNGSPMRTAQDYRDRRSSAEEKHNKYKDAESSRKRARNASLTHTTHYNYRTKKSYDKNGNVVESCTETIDTLDGIL